MPALPDNGRADIASVPTHVALMVTGDVVAILLTETRKLMTPVPPTAILIGFDEFADKWEYPA